MARSVRHLLETLDELNRLNVEYISFRENINTGGPLGRAVVVIVGDIAELERNLIIVRVGPIVRACGANASGGRRLATVTSIFAGESVGDLNH